MTERVKARRRYSSRGEVYYRTLPVLVRPVKVGRVLSGLVESRHGGTEQGFSRRRKARFDDHDATICSC